MAKGKATQGREGAETKEAKEPKVPSPPRGAPHAKKAEYVVGGGLEEPPPPKKFDPGKRIDKSRSGKDMDDLPGPVAETMREIEMKHKEGRHPDVFGVQREPAKGLLIRCQSS